MRLVSQDGKKYFLGCNDVYLVGSNQVYKEPVIPSSEYSSSLGNLGTFPPERTDLHPGRQ